MSNDDLMQAFEALLDDADEGDFSDNRIVLEDENGEDVEFEFIDLIEYSGKTYGAFLPTEETDEAPEIVLLEIIEDENSDEDALISIEDDELLMTVFEIFKEKNKDMFNFVEWY